MREAMKKILFATTALVASAGVAAADISVSGSAAMGLYGDESTPTGVGNGGVETAADQSGVYSMMKVVITGSGTADNGMTFGASIDASAGEDYDRGDFEYDGGESGTFGLGAVHVATGGLKVTADQDGIDDLSDDDNSHDIQIDYTMGDFSVSVTNNVDGDDSNGDPVVPNGDGSQFSYKAGFSMAGISVTVSGNDLDDSTAIDLGYTVSDALGLTAHIDQNGGDQETKVGMSYGMGAVGLTASYAMYDTADDDWDLGISYSEGAMSVSASTDEESDWELAGSYDLGGGLSAEGGMNADSDYYLGVAMSF
jgi:outer membrane protein OmpU